ncbi:Aldo/keto reductase [Candidatus Sulfopaludibacter sp. SbA4]|nr:Aldo/keto reductase [Candidatus Sulfopaludibacter sp. SbA4]
MKSASRRNFLAAGLALPAAGLAEPSEPEQVPAQSPTLTYRTLGRTGLKVTSMSFGCMTTSDESVIRRAADMGILHFDTARSYQNGNNERMVGVALKGRRKQVIVSSKTLAQTRQEAMDQLDTSLRELGTDYLDIWYLHARNSPAEVTDDLLEVQRAAKKSGKIRYAGVSTHFNMDQMLAHLVERGQTDVVLTTYNFSMQNVAAAGEQARKTDMTAAIQSARKAGMGIVTMKAMAGGVARVGRGDRLYGADAEALKGILGKPGGALAAIKWVLRNQSVDTAIVCMTDHDQLEENLRAMAEPFGSRDEQLLRSLVAYIGPSYCRMCGSCNGVCARGVPVPDVLRFLSYAEGYGQFAMARERFLELPADVRATRCEDCSSCSVECPNGVEVRRNVMRAQAMLA